MAQLSDKVFNKELEKITGNIINMIKEEIHKQEDSKNFIKPRLDEINQNQKEKEACISEMKKMLEALEHKKTELLKEVSVLQVEKRQQKEKVRQLENKCRDLEKVYETKEQELTSVSFEISSKDKEILEMDRKKLSIYKDLTNVEWDYSIPIQNSHIVGYVENSKNSYIQAFHYNTDKMTEAELMENLWQETEKGIAGDWRNLVQTKEKQEDKNEMRAEN